ncbi:MAG: indolepyruvate ferredoxin oxidoreductase subunit alpha [Clostridia bacterium]|nr:indolepyruvate ferredoxin oxidoreductase subunit alpha [Clostridia bacterium]
MRQLLSGNEAIARGAYEAGVRVAAAYPGTPSTEILENIAEYPEIYAEWSPNEKVALEVGAGAAMAGARALVAMKHVGLNVAADPFFTLAYTGVNGGLVVVSADDPGMHSSQNEQDNRLYARAAQVPMLEPSDSQEAKDFVKVALDLSEQYDTPVLMRITTRIAHSKSLVELAERAEIPLRSYIKDTGKYVMLPGFARERHPLLLKRMEQLGEFSNTSDLQKVEWGVGKRHIGFICAGVAYQYVRESFPEASILKLGMTYPLPRRLIEEFASQVDELYVIEELEPFMEDQLKAWGIKVEGKSRLPRVGELSPEIIHQSFVIQLGPTNKGDVPFPVPASQPSDPEMDMAEEPDAVTPTIDWCFQAIPGRPPVLCPGCPHRGVFYALQRLRLTVTGDIGCYTLGALRPLSSMDSCLCMGASISMAHGMEKARGKDTGQRTVAVIGDSTFLHSGIAPLMDVVYNRGSSTVIILDNRTTAMTGHQDHPGTGFTIRREPTWAVDLEALCRALGVKQIWVLDPLDLDKLREGIRKATEADEPSVIIARHPCVLLENPFQDRLYQVIPDKCVSCGLCRDLGCPGLIFELRSLLPETGSSSAERLLPRIDPDQCRGCGLCAQVCNHQAIAEVPKSQGAEEG